MVALAARLPKVAKPTERFFLAMAFASEAVFARIETASAVTLPPPERYALLTLSAEAFAWLIVMPTSATLAPAPVPPTLACAMPSSPVR